MIALFLLSGLLNTGKTVVTRGVVKPVVYVAKKTQSNPVVQAVEHAAVYTVNKVTKIVTFGSYGK